MIYTMPGMVTRLNLQANEAGVYDGQSSHFSGDGFSGMHFKGQALPTDQFEAWVKGARGSGQVLDGQTYAQLTKQSSYVAPVGGFGGGASTLTRWVSATCQEVPASAWGGASETGRSGAQLYDCAPGTKA